MAVVPSDGKQIVLVVQPCAAGPAARLPYPIFINAKSEVLRQDIYQGNPYMFLCFRNQKTQDMILMSELTNCPELLEVVQQDKDWVPAFRSKDPQDMYDMTCSYGFEYRWSEYPILEKEDTNGDQAAVSVG